MQVKIVCTLKHKEVSPLAKACTELRHSVRSSCTAPLCIRSCLKVFGLGTPGAGGGAKTFPVCHAAAAER